MLRLYWHNLNRFLPRGYTFHILSVFCEVFTKECFRSLLTLPSAQCGCLNAEMSGIEFPGYDTSKMFGAINVGYPEET